MKFSELGLSEKVLLAVTEAGYEQPTPIQEGAIPHVLARRDVLGIAQTGTGKTAGFTLPMLTLLEKGRARARMPRSLILEPTRELAAQVEQAFVIYGAQHKLTVALLIGGVSFADQDRKLDHGADVLIATPGRLLDHFERGKLMLNGVETMVVDEADRMLDMGFIPDIERIFKLLPITRQTLFFSATMPPEIQRLTNLFLHNPVRVEVAPPATIVDTIEQKFIAAPSGPKEKRACLRQIIRDSNVDSAIIFCNRKRDVSTLHKSLVKHKFNAGALHGDMDQYKRLETLSAFRDGTIKLLVASDVAARGLDIPEVDHIINYDTPLVAEDYVHRIGRTGRAGRKGYSITLVTSHDMRLYKAIQELAGVGTEWIGAAPDTTARSSKEVRKQRPRNQRNARKQNQPAPKHPPGKPAPGKSAHARPAPGKPARKDQTGGAKPAQKGEPIKGLGDHVPAFLKRPTHAG